MIISNMKVNSKNDYSLKRYNDTTVHYEISVRDFCNLLEDGVIVLTESRHGVQNGISYRVDTPNAFAGQQVHIHIGDYAWNIDGTRSHKSRWPNRAPSNKIKNIAATQLGIDKSLLEGFLDCTLVVTLNRSTEQAILESASVLGEPVKS